MIGADVIVTGDQDLLALGHVNQVKIRTPREFPEVLRPGTGFPQPGR